MPGLALGIHDFLLGSKQGANDRGKLGHADECKKAAAMAAFFVLRERRDQLFDCAISLPMRLKRAFCSLLSEA